jgi:hypothetical protein
VRFVTHQFAHVETLERVRRWLIQAGIDPSRIEAHTHGLPRLAVAVEPGEAAEVALLIDAAESGDPDGCPSFLELAHRRHIYPNAVPADDATTKAAGSSSFVVGWRPVDADLEVTQASTDVELQRAYREHWGERF